jgi:hypothetical protein
MDSYTDKKSLDALRKSEPDNLITLSNGVVLRGKMVPPLVYVTVVGAFPMPKPPLWKDPLLGRMVENPDDEEYIERVASVENEKNSAILNVMIVYGTEVVDIPAHVSRPFVEYKPIPKKKRSPKEKEEKEKKEAEVVEKIYPDWLKRYRLLGLPIFEEDKDWMYLTWIKSEVATTKEDLESIQKVVGRLSGVPEKDVQAAESFPGSNP